MDDFAQAKNRERLIRGCIYWRELKPSQMALFGTAHPKQWAILQGFVRILEEYLGVREPPAPIVEKPILVEQMDTEQVKSIFQ